MRKLSILLSITVLAAMILAACGGVATSTAAPTENVPPTTVESTATSELGTETATEVPTETTTTNATSTTEAGIPVTGGENSDRLSNMLKFAVLDQTGQQAGKVEDMVLDLSKANIIYVVVNAGGKKIPVPWAFLKVGPASATSYPNGQQNVFLLQATTDMLKNAPELNLKNVPQLGEAPDSWDIAFRKYWAAGGNSSGSNTPAPAGTAATDMTATATSASTGTGTSLATSTPTTSAGTSLATSTPAVSAGTGQGIGAGQGATAIQGVQLASQVLGAKVTVGVSSLSLTTPSASGAGTSAATSTPGTGGTTSATSTPSAGGGATSSTSTPTASSAATSTTPSASGGSAGSAASTPSSGAGTQSLSATIDDLIVNTDSGNVLYIVVKTSFADGEHLIPVPLRLLQLNSSQSATGDTNVQEFILNLDAALLQNAPFFQRDKFPDLTMPDWNSEFNSFWQNNGSGSGAQATATP